MPHIVVEGRSSRQLRADHPSLYSLDCVKNAGGPMLIGVLVYFTVCCPEGRDRIDVSSKLFTP